MFQNLIRTLDAARAFNATLYIERKVAAINAFFSDASLDSAVVGISGGVDSAVVYTLLRVASERAGSPIRHISPLVVPIFAEGATNQQLAVETALLMLSSEPYLVVYVDATPAYLAIIEAAPPCSSMWARGQMASVIRTPIFYYQAAILQAQGYKSIVVGTTNRDEGSYIGFYGKASDGMNDLQPIADIHKSEVWAVARVLGVPDRIVQTMPRGDVWDGAVDEDLIGAPYWFLQMYLQCKELGLDPSPNFSEQERGTWDIYAAAIEDLHSKNAHKYAVGIPSHFIDVLPRAVPGGWQ